MTEFRLYSSKQQMYYTFIATYEQKEEIEKRFSKGFFDDLDYEYFKKERIKYISITEEYVKDKKIDH